MCTHKNETEDLLLHFTKNCETHIEQTHRKPQETLELKLTKPAETFSFTQTIVFGIECTKMIELTSREVYNSIFNITERNNKFELFIFPNSNTGKVSYEKVRDEIEKDLGSSDNTNKHLQYIILGPIIIEEYKKDVTKKMKNDKYMDLLEGFTHSVFQVFENYLRTEVDLAADDIGLVLDGKNSIFIKYAIQPGFYSFKDHSEVLLENLESEYEGVKHIVGNEDIRFSMK